MDQFPPDRPLLETVMETGRGFSTWTPYALFCGEKLLGNVSLMPLRIWVEGRFQEVMGIASVATDPTCRRMGVARRLMDHCLAITDRQGLAGVLFTSLPRVYEPFGFCAVEQTYRAIAAERLRVAASTPQCAWNESLSGPMLGLLARIYRTECPDYNGKVDRDAAYWEFYRTLLDASPPTELLISFRGGQPSGYARCELESDRILVTELCANPSDENTAEGLLAEIADRASRRSADWVTLALPPDHFVFRFFQNRAILPEREPEGFRRETFMARPAGGHTGVSLAGLQWSLADKF
ncbi:MAG: GNAT family N-acetyltransferase [Pirellulales bacterium]|nr:GNAT family N-acetyltransferase [Pirellulales bacterium]